MRKEESVDHATPVVSFLAGSSVVLVSSLSPLVSTGKGEENVVKNILFI